MKKLRLIKPLDNGIYDPEICAKCRGVSDYIDATKKIIDIDLPLCDKCWQLRDKILYGDPK